MIETSAFEIAAELNLVFALLLLFLPLGARRYRPVSCAFGEFVATVSFVSNPAITVEALALAAPGFSSVRHLVFLALAVVGSGLVLAGWAGLYRDVDPSLSPGAGLIEGGVYGMMRHPQYTGLAAVSLGMLAGRPSLPAAALWVLLVALLARLGRSEDRELEGRFGDRWRAYRDRVGFWGRRL